MIDERERTYTKGFYGQKVSAHGDQEQMNHEASVIIRFSNAIFKTDNLQYETPTHLV